MDGKDKHLADRKFPYYQLSHTLNKLSCPNSQYRSSIHRSSECSVMVVLYGNCRICPTHPLVAKRLLAHNVTKKELIKPEHLLHLVEEFGAEDGTLTDDVRALTFCFLGYASYRGSISSQNFMCEMFPSVKSIWSYL